MTDHRATDTEQNDRLHEEIAEQHELERQRKEDTIRWLEEHLGFRPFGVEW